MNRRSIAHPLCIINYTQKAKKCKFCFILDRVTLAKRELQLVLFQQIAELFVDDRGCGL